MHVDPYIVLGSAVIGFLVGMTGAGGGALMTPMLILLFGVKPSSAISSDLVAAVMMRPIGAAVHLRQKTVNLRLVGWMVLGSVPMAFLGAYLLHLMGHAKTAQSNIELALGIALLVGASAMVLRYVLDRRSGQRFLKDADHRHDSGHRALETQLHPVAAGLLPQLGLELVEVDPVGKNADPSILDAQFDHRGFQCLADRDHAIRISRGPLDLATRQRVLRD